MRFKILCATLALPAVAAVGFSSKAKELEYQELQDFKLSF